MMKGLTELAELMTRKKIEIKIIKCARENQGATSRIGVPRLRLKCDCCESSAFRESTIRARVRKWDVPSETHALSGQLRESVHPTHRRSRKQITFPEVINGR